MIRIYAYKKIFNNSKSRLENESSLTLSQNGNTFKVLSQLFQTFARYCTITPANLYLNFSQCQRSDPASRITIRDPLWMDTCRTTKRRSWSEIEKNNKQTSKKRERNDRAKKKKRRVKRCMYKRRYEKKKKKAYKAWKRVGREVENSSCVPHGMRAKWSAKTETARCATASSVGRTQGLPATSAEGSFTTLTPSIFSSVDFFQLFETAYEETPSSPFRSFQRSRKRISQGNHRLGTQMRYDRRCNYRNVIISGNISVFPFDSLIFFFFFFVFHNLHLHISNWKESRLFDCTF